MWASKIQVVGTVAEFAKKPAPQPEEGALQLFQWALHPIESAKDVSNSAIYHTIEPILNTISVASYPIASVLLTLAGIFYICGMRDRAMTTISRTSITYIIIQLLPLLIKSCLSLL